LQTLPNPEELEHQGLFPTMIVFAIGNIV
jgi:hypothetical protein